MIEETVAAGAAEGPRAKTAPANGGRPARSRTSGREDPLVALMREISARDGLAAEAQKEAAKLFGLAFDARRHPDAKLLAAALENGMRALLAEPPNVRLSRQSRKLVERRVQVMRAPLRAMSRDAPTTWLLFGLFVLLILGGLGIAAWVAAGLMLDSEVLGFPTRDVILVLIFGAFGSIVSILRRVDDINEKRSVPIILFWTGFTKPLVGGLFALFFYALVRSKVIAIDLTQYDNGPFFAAAAFLAGFSERFVPDLAKRVEGTLNVRDLPNDDDDDQEPGREGALRVDVPEDELRRARATEQASGTTRSRFRPDEEVTPAGRGG